MHVALIISGAMAAVGLVLYVHHRLTGGDDTSRSITPDNNAAHIDTTVHKNPEQTDESKAQEECCGLHITCERDSLSPVFGEEIEYFDDEELDAFINFDVENYTADDIELFRDVLLTLSPEDIAPWARSIQQRGIVLPDVVKDELFLIVEETRSKAAVS